MSHFYPTDYLASLAAKIEGWSEQLGFQQVGITDTYLADEEAHLKQWLQKGYQGDMQWMADHGDKRSRPDELLPGTVRVISLRMNYLPPDTEPISILKSSDKAYIARYTLGRDYHKSVRTKLSNLAKLIEDDVKEFVGDEVANQRPFVDSAPVLERPLAVKAGLGWQGKHTLVINEEAGSWFFLGEILTNIPLPLSHEIVEDKCGDCEACLKVCPTDAFPQPYVLDARRCISYLTIEHKGAIPIEFREVMGNRVFGCDDCQAICPWNKHAQFTDESDFHPRNSLQAEELKTLYQWDRETFLKKTEGSAIRRAGYEGWIRNLSIGMGNADPDPEVVLLLEQRRGEVSPMVDQHIEWAINQQKRTSPRKRKLKNPDKPLNN